MLKSLNNMICHEFFLSLCISKSEFLLIKDYGEIGVNIAICILAHWVKYWIYCEKCSVRIPRLNMFRIEMQECVTVLRRNKKFKYALERLVVLGVNRN